MSDSIQNGFPCVCGKRLDRPGSCGEESCFLAMGGFISSWEEEQPRNIPELGTTGEDNGQMSRGYKETEQ